MINDIKKMLGDKIDSNFNLFEKNYKENKLSNTALYNLLKKEYSLNKNNLNKIINIKEETIKNKEKISIIIPTYNRKKQLKECLDSIFCQTYSNFEIIIIDDCSTDKTPEFLKKTYQDNRIMYIKNKENLGAGLSRKKGYLMSTGKYIIFCDDDDYYIDNDFFNKVVNIFKDKNISLICSNTYLKNENKNQYTLNELNFENMISNIKYLEKFQYKYIKPNSTFSTVFRKSILDSSDMANMNMVNDSSIYMRALLIKGNVYVNKNIIGIYRIHSNNISFNLKADFLIKNLEEKKYIYDKIKENKLIEKPELWLEEQVLLTIRYYYDGVKPSKKENDKVMLWLENNVNNYKEIKLKLIVHKIKLFVKRIIKKIKNK